MEIIDDRHDRSALSSPARCQPSSDTSIFGNPTIADAVLDRLMHGVHRLQLKGESMRKLGAVKATLGEAAAGSLKSIRSRPPPIPGSKI